jgi:D-galactarolactone cycloisomerase
MAAGRYSFVRLRTGRRRLGRRIEGFDIGWFEELVPPEDLDGHLAVKATLSIPIATGKCEFTRVGFRGLLERRAADYIQPDLCAAGGLSECKKIADMVLAYGVRFAPHVWGTGIAVSAAVQLLAVVADWTPPSLGPVEPMLEFDRTEHPVRSGLLATPIVPVNGYVTVPTGPGLGIEVNRDVLARFRADV